MTEETTRRVVTAEARYKALRDGSILDRGGARWPTDPTGRRPIQREGNRDHEAYYHDHAHR
jgi:hypothetical protein